jgi:hypothetical protein
MESTGYFEEKPGVKSAIRLIVFMFAVYAVIASAWLFYKNTDYTAGIAVFVAISSIALSAKLIQKPMEANANDNKQ